MAALGRALRASQAVEALAAGFEGGLAAGGGGAGRAAGAGGGGAALAALEAGLPALRARPTALRPLWRCLGWVGGQAARLSGRRAEARGFLRSGLQAHYNARLREVYEAGLPAAATEDVRRLLRECRDGSGRAETEGGGAEGAGVASGAEGGAEGPEEPLDLEALRSMLRSGEVRPEAVRAALARAGLVAVARVAAVV